jgi:hypothetical protein
VKIIGSFAEHCRVIMLGARPRPGRGLEDFAASQGHWAFVERFLDFGMRHAVKRHTSGIEVPNLDDPNMIRLVGNAPFVMARQEF